MLATAQMLIKKGIIGLDLSEFSLNSLTALISRILTNVWLISGIVLFAFSFIVYLFVLTKFRLNIVYPIMISNGIIFVSLASWFFFKETLSMTQIAGIASILLGIFLIMPK